MRFGILALTAILPLALGGCGQEDATTVAEANSQASEVGGNAAAPVAPSGAQAFVNKAAASDRFEIETSRLAASSAASSAVMAYAREMIAAHTKSTADLKAAVAKNPSGIVIDDQLSAGQQATLEDMKMKKGYLFDAAYMAAQVYGHDQTLTELKAYAASGENPALKGFAQGLVPIVDKHLEEAKALNGKIGVGSR